ncbi:carboxymuconolactone decarboxylase family protein [Proteus mirabilis]|uniref:carboxymuconolactone decarboxylase family protein n=1 Tax=Proteus TaxID=583 RepID=UPI0018C739AA|nr:carboxymuconolactone decarboxylase family protein [Proteus vulgaris]MBG3078849.1 carboxymuconolactone decarboxylase family protein [Proteus mirabilis]QPN89075.1 carboxymuconolactone decarboxylase family protein [Proteus vulgaris]
MSKLRLSYPKLSPAAYAGLIQCKTALESSSLDIMLIELVYLRVSQINGCAFCLEMHSTSLRHHGVAQNKLDALNGWQVSERFTEKERAALLWADAVSQISAKNTNDDIYQQVKAYFSDTEMSDLTLAIGLMNAFNRIAVSLRQ